MKWLVRKRDGGIVEYERKRIEFAIFRAMKATGVDGDFIGVARDVERHLYENFFIKGNVPHVEEIQDQVERALMKAGYEEVAKAYILYRQKRAEARDLFAVFSSAEEIIEKYLNQNDWRVRENSNMSYSLQGLNFHISSSLTARYWLNKIYTEPIRRAHSEGEFHIHDLGVLAPYCVGWDLKDLLLRGFGGVAGKVEASPARHFRTALGQIVNFFYTLQGEAAGAQAFSSFDTYLAPFVAKDGLSYEQVKQAMQEFLFNVNVPTRVGFQTPFTNLTFDLKVPEFMKEEKAIVGGEEINATYGEFQKEVNMINRAYAELMMQGDAKGRIFTFPIPTYNITRDFDWENEALKPIWEMTGKYGIPYFSNFVNSDMKPEDARSMCCRLRLDTRELKKRGGGLFGANPLTGSIGVVTINMPRIAYLSRSKEEFLEKLETLMEIAKDSLEIKRKIVEDLTEKGLFPYSRVYLEEIKRLEGKYWANHFSTIGLIGMNEAALNLLGVSISDPEARQWAIEILTFMRKKLSDFQEETGNLYNLEATPAEGASYRLAKRDKEKFPNIITSGSVNAPYYTNSVHMPVYEAEDIFQVLEHQDDLQVLFTGGTVVHLFIGEAIYDWRMVESLVRKIVNNYRMPYFSITPTFSICPVHGYIAGEHYYCPYPHSDEEIARFGVEVEMNKEELKEFQDGAYRIVEDSESSSARTDGLNNVKIVIKRV
ncbi:MAG: ribonucleoside triphosphate reductase [Candidatus Aminicenantes bacterium]|nr:ribonucleoside triphosphate reductase [Candidatus Aminicenantes bacterium]